MQEEIQLEVDGIKSIIKRKLGQRAAMEDSREVSIMQKSALERDEVLLDEAREHHNQLTKDETNYKDKIKLDDTIRFEK